MCARGLICLQCLQHAGKGRQEQRRRRLALWQAGSQPAEASRVLHLVRMSTGTAHALRSMQHCIACNHSAAQHSRLSAAPGADVVEHGAAVCRHHTAALQAGHRHLQAGQGLILI